MKLVFASVAALAASASALTAGFCDGQLAGNYQHDNGTPETGMYYTCANDESSDPTEHQCSQGAVADVDGNMSMEQLVYNPNSGNADCSITSPGGYCDYSANVDFSANAGVDASIDCSFTPEEENSGSGDAETTTTAAETTTMVMPDAYMPDFCQSRSSGNVPFEEACDEGYYYQCANGYTYLMQCPTDTVYDPSTSTCNWSYAVNDCSDTATTTTVAADTTTTAATTTTMAEAEVVSCEYDWSSESMGVCETTNWCNGMQSGYFLPDDVADCTAGAYYMCNWGAFTSLSCPAGQRWYVPSPTPEWATQWYGYCHEESMVTCA